MAFPGEYLVHFIARAAVGFVWIYHGLIPKLLFQHADETTILRNAGASEEATPAFVFWIGCAEIVMGLWVWLGLPSPRWPLIVTVVFGIGTTIGAALQSPEFLVAAFNPVSLNIQFIALSLIGLLTLKDSSSNPG